MADLKSRRIDNFESLLAEVARLASDRHAIAFRGHRTGDRGDPSAALVTGLEQACSAIDRSLEKAGKREIAIIREFIRRAHHYPVTLPEPYNYFEWLALMQHHGAPTRLLDWTYSLYVATHFAVSHASRHETSDLTIWMVDTEWCLQASSRLCSDLGKPAYLSHRPIRYDSEGNASSELLDGQLPASVWPVNPFRLNERSTLQKGVFLAPGDVSKPFATNLTALPDHDVESNLVCFIIPRSQIGPISKILYDANITETTLFPGLDGFARSLWLSARFLSLDRLVGLRSIM